MKINKIQRRILDEIDFEVRWWQENYKDEYTFGLWLLSTIARGVVRDMIKKAKNWRHFKKLWHKEKQRRMRGAKTDKDRRRFHEHFLELMRLVEVAVPELKTGT